MPNTNASTTAATTIQAPVVTPAQRPSAGSCSARGAPVYKKVGKAKLRNGKASLKLKKLSKGKNKLVFEITLKGGKYGNAEVAKTVKVKHKR